MISLIKRNNCGKALDVARRSARHHTVAMAFVVSTGSCASHKGESRKQLTPI